MEELSGAPQNLPVRLPDTPNFERRRVPADVRRSRRRYADLVLLTGVYLRICALYICVNLRETYAGQLVEKIWVTISMTEPINVHVLLLPNS